MKPFTNEQQLNLRWDLSLKYQLIEIIALWEGRLTTNHLIRAFGIGRQQASKHINQYIREIAPDNLAFDPKIKGYTATEQFSPQIAKGSIDEYLQWLSVYPQLRHPQTHHIDDDSLTWRTTSNLSPSVQLIGPIQSVFPPLRQINPLFVRAILKAAFEKKRVEIQYTSLTHPSPKDRMIAPHTLIFNGYRWHVRAYCEESGLFKDFLLSRMTDIAEVTLDATLSVSDDLDWNTWLPVIIQADQRLSESEKQVIERDFGMTNGCLQLKLRAPLISYYLQLLRIDRSELHPNPFAQQIVLANREQLLPWLLTD